MCTFARYLVFFFFALLVFCHYKHNCRSHFRCVGLYCRRQESCQIEIILSNLKNLLTKWFQRTRRGSSYLQFICNWVWSCEILSEMAVEDVWSESSDVKRWSMLFLTTGTKIYKYFMNFSQNNRANVHVWRWDSFYRKWSHFDAAEIGSVSIWGIISTNLQLIHCLTWFLKKQLIFFSFS